MLDHANSPWEKRILVGVFLVALFAHAFLATRNWTAGFMPGHEFRQAQTAITAHYIDRDDNFSLLYETPIVGKPWISILLEVPIYEWCVVGLSRWTGLPHYEAARGITLACFYLSLPACYLLLGRLGVPGPRRLLFLALFLLCPVYIFYSRAFLIDSMEFMACAWYLWAFLRLMEQRRWQWFLLTSLIGTVAALIKSATLAVWLIPAAATVGWQLWRELRTRAGIGATLHTAFWGLAGVTIPLGALEWWIRLTDPMKAMHASAWIFTAGNLSAGNWGLADISARVSPQLWRTLADRWRDAIMPPWLIGMGLACALIFLPAARWRVAGLAAVFFLAQLLFPFAYAYQDYYFYSCAVFLLGAFGFALLALLDSKWSRKFCWVIIAVPMTVQPATYWRSYYGGQMVKSNGGFSFTEILRKYVPEDAVIIVAGADWAAMIPLYSHHRALMIRNGLAQDSAYLARALAELADEDVAALVLVYDERGDQALRDMVAARFDLSTQPTFSHHIADVYCSRRYDAAVRAGLKECGNYGDLIPGPPIAPIDWSKETFRISGGMARTSFHNVSPAPVCGHFAFGPGYISAEEGLVQNAHPDSDLWLHPPGGATRIEWDYGIFSGAYTRAGDKTDGVEFTVTGELPLGARRIVYQRHLDPVRQAADRGAQKIVVPYRPIAGEILHFSTRPGPALAYDWAYWARIEVK